jgi:hypothetical protein
MKRVLAAAVITVMAGAGLADGAMAQNAGGRPQITIAGPPLSRPLG